MGNFHNPTCSSLWTSGDEFKQRFDAVLRENYGSFGGHDILPVWFEKRWQVLWNRNEHNRDHGIAPHSDYCETFSSDGGPITSFSIGRGGILTLMSQTSGKGASKMLFQEHGDVLVMAGKFQKDFFHGVPERTVWRDLCAGQGSGFVSMEEWEKKGVQHEIPLHDSADAEEQHLRFNCTLRWHHTHWKTCPEYVAPLAAMGVVSSPVVSGLDLPKQSSGSSSVSASQPLLGIKKRLVETSSEPKPRHVIQAEKEEETELLQKSQKTVKVVLECLGHYFGSV